jgi:anti-anti-sigma factor
MHLHSFNRTRPGPTALTFRVCFVGDVATLVVEGELDQAGAGALADALEAIGAAGVTHIAVDAAGVTFIDSRGLGVLERFADDLRVRRGWLRVERPSRVVSRLLDVAASCGVLGSSLLVELGDA